jgi:hypothetical protein
MSLTFKVCSCLTVLQSGYSRKSALHFQRSASVQSLTDTLEDIMFLRICRDYVMMCLVCTTRIYHLHILKFGTAICTGERCVICQQCY